MPTMRPPLKTIENISDAHETLKERAESHDRIRGVLIVELHEDGTQRVFTNTISMHEKCYLKCYLDSYINQWFNSEEE